jgi:hypothetical protein
LAVLACLLQAFFIRARIPGDLPSRIVETIGALLAAGVPFATGCYLVFNGHLNRNKFNIEYRLQSACLALFQGRRSYFEAPFGPSIRLLYPMKRSLPLGEANCMAPRRSATTTGTCPATPS